MKREVIGILFRYLLIVLAGLGNLYIFYKVLTPLTIRTLSFILSLKGEVFVKGISIATENLAIVLVPACVAGAAFYLMFILIFSTPNINSLNRLKILIYSFAILFALNVLRIIFLFSISNQPYFSLVHWIFWHLLSTIFVVGIWLVFVYTYKIRSIPIYSDAKYIYKKIKITKG